MCVCVCLCVHLCLNIWLNIRPNSVSIVVHVHLVSYLMETATVFFYHTPLSSLSTTSATYLYFLFLFTSFFSAHAPPVLDFTTWFPPHSLPDSYSVGGNHTSTHIDLFTLFTSCWNMHNHTKTTPLLRHWMRMCTSLCYGYVTQYRFWDSKHDASWKRSTQQQMDSEKTSLLMCNVAFLLCII